MIEKTDVTKRAEDAGWTLSEGWQVRAWMMHDDDHGDPREKGDVYNSDFEEENYSHPTRGFCRHCGNLIREVPVEQVHLPAHLASAESAANLRDEIRVNVGSHVWEAFTSSSRRYTCPSESVYHELDDPVVVRWWREDRWEFVGVLVEVVDADGRVWGESSLWSVEAGTFPTEIDPETGEITSKEIDPLTDPHHPLPDLIDEAMDAAADALGAHAARPPLITRSQKHGGETL